MNRDEYYASVEAYKTDYLEHHGILGQKWGVRRFQNEDGTYTSAGKERRMSRSERKAAKKEAKREAKAVKKEEKYQKAKEKAIEKGNASFAFKNRNKFTDEDYERISAVIDRKVKYHDLVTKVERMKNEDLKLKTDRIMPIMQLTNQTLGTVNQALNLSDRFLKKGNDNNGDTFVQRTFAENGKVASETTKYFDSVTGTKRSDTRKFDTRGPVDYSAVRAAYEKDKYKRK